MKIFCKAVLLLSGSFLINKFTSGLQVPLYFMKYNISFKQVVCFYFQKCTADFRKQNKKELHQLTRNYEENGGSKLTTWKKYNQE
jgi:hypothetical protein